MAKIYTQALLDDIARRHKLPMPLLKEASQAILSTIHDGLQRDGVVRISQFGTFRLKPVAARKGINPQTREPITIPAHHRVIFSPGKALRELIQPDTQPPIPLHSTALHRENELPAPELPRHEKQSETVQPRLPQSRIGVAIPVEEETAKSLPAETTPAPIDSGEKVFNIAESSAIKEGAPAAADSKENDKTTPDDIDLGRFEQPDTAGNTNAKTKRTVIAGTLVAAILLSALALPYLLSSTPASSDQAIAGNPVSALEETAPNTIAGTDRNGNETPDTAPAPSPQTDEKIQGSGTLPHPAKRKSDTDNANLAANTSAQQISDVPNSISPDESESTHKFYFMEKHHRLVAGDSLWRLAARSYHDPLLWPLIYQANSKRIENPDFVRTGHTLIIPTLQGTPDALTKRDRHKIAEGYYLAYRYYREAGHNDAMFALLEAKRFDHSVVERELAEASASQP